MGTINTFYDWNWGEAERELKQALQLNPNASIVHMNYSWLLTITGRHKQAIAEARHAQELDPLSSFINGHVGIALYMAGQFDETIEEINKTIILNPQYWFFYRVLGIAYRGKLMFAEAIEKYEEAVDLSGGIPFVVAELAATFYISGDKIHADKLFDSLKVRAKQEYVPPICFYLIYLARGELDKSFQWFERAYEEHDSFICWFNEVPIEGVRIPDDARFKAVISKIGLKP